MNASRKQYVIPTTKAISYHGESLMIPISGQTTPEDADAKGAYFYDEESDEKGGGNVINVWDL